MLENLNWSLAHGNDWSVPLSFRHFTLSSKTIALNKRRATRTMPLKVSIPVVGVTSSGKSTLINALLQGLFTETASLRCTNAVLKFQLCGDNSDEESESVANIRIQTQNANKADSTALHELELPISGPCLLKTQGKAQIELIDVPGWDESPGNETDNNSLAQEYIFTKWHTFACVLYVADVSAADPMKQLKLLGRFRDLNKSGIYIDKQGSSNYCHWKQGRLLLC